LYKPDKLHLSTRVIYNSNECIDKYIDKLANMSETDNELHNILLINSWNEWGEKMHIEPSKEKGFYYLNKIQSLLSHYHKN
jgi:hypothetical protein